jgi:hypothetical protein
VGVRFHPDHQQRMVYWYFHGLVTAQQCLAEQARAIAQGDFSGWETELLYLEPRAEFHVDMYSGFTAMKPLLFELFPRMPRRCAVVCSQEQLTSLPGFWYTVMSNSVELQRIYELFPELSQAVDWLGVSLAETVDILARLREASMKAFEP